MLPNVKSQTSQVPLATKTAFALKVFVWPVEAVAPGAVQIFEAIALFLTGLYGVRTAGTDVVVGIAVGVI